jgi:hypothetical protein
MVINAFVILFLYPIQLQLNLIFCNSEAINRLYSNSTDQFFLEKLILTSLNKNFQIEWNPQARYHVYNRPLFTAS